MNKFDVVCALFNQAHMLTTVLQTELVVCGQDLYELQAWNSHRPDYNPDKAAINVLAKRVIKLKKLIRKSKKREERRYNAFQDEFLGV